MGAFYGCGFLGAQDTLYDHNGRHYFEECYVEGSIDFIYGDGKSLYKVSTEQQQQQSLISAHDFLSPHLSPTEEAN